MGGVGHKPPPLLLGDLQAAGELVELIGQLGQLVVPGQGDAVGVLPCPHGADAPQQGPHPPGEGGGKGPKEHQPRQAHHRGDQPEVALELHQQSPLAAVLLVEVHRPHHLVAVHHRGGPTAVEHPVLVPAGEGVVALQGGDNLPQEEVLSYGRILPGVVEHQAGLVGDDKALNLQVLQLGDGLGHRLTGELVGGNQGVGHQSGLVCHGGLLRAEEEVLVHNHRVGIHQHQQGCNDAEIPQGQPGLEGVGQVQPPLVRQLGQPPLPVSSRGNSTPPPTWYTGGWGWPGRPPPSPECGGCGHPPSGTPRCIRSPTPGSAAVPGCRPGWDGA